MGKKSARIIRMEDLGLEDDGIVTTTSSKGASDSFYSAKQENRKQSAASRSGKKSEAPSVSDSNQQLNEDSESGLYYDDTESGLWSFRAVGMDEKSVPFDEESVLPTITQEGESNSINYSIDDYSEDPLDRYSLADMELAVVAKPQSKVQRPKVKKTRTARGRKVTTNSEPPIPEYVQPSPPIRRSVGSSSQQDEDQCDQRSRVPSKAQKRCTRMLLAAFVAMFLIVIGVGLVIYFFYLKDDPSSISGPSAGGGGDGDDFLDPPPGYDYVTITASPTTPPSSETGPLEEIASPTGQPVVPPTRSPVFAEIAALTNYLATEYSVVFPDDPSAPNNQAVAWLLEEAEEVNTSVMVLSEKLVQRFGLVALTMNLDLDLDLDANSTSLAEPLVDECDWTGVSCTNGTVTELSWGNAQLEGAIPPEIGLLTDLTYLDLSQNQLEGSLPDELFELTELEELFLYDNQLTGTISDRIGDLNNLERLHLSHNELSGSLPLTMRSPIEFIRPYRKHCRKARTFFTLLSFLSLT
jgi:hypothetical protein